MRKRKAFAIPLKANAQRFFIALGGVTYFCTWVWNSVAGCWVLSIADENRKPIVNSIPVVTGRNLLAPYTHLGFKGGLVVQTDNDPDVVPTFDNLGSTSHVYYVAR